VAEQAALVAHRRRKQAAAQALGSQVPALADVAFPGLTACFRTGLESKTLRMLLAPLADPARVVTMSRDEIVRHAAQHHVRMVRPKAAQVIAAAAAAICVRERQRATAVRLLAGDAARFEALLAEMDACDHRRARLHTEPPPWALRARSRRRRRRRLALGDGVHRGRPGDLTVSRGSERRDQRSLNATAPSRPTA
jgi:hypothetical protein